MFHSPWLSQHLFFHPFLQSLTPSLPLNCYSASLCLGFPICKSGLVIELSRPLNELIQGKYSKQGLAHSPRPSQWPCDCSSFTHGRISHSLIHSLAGLETLLG